MIEVFLTAQEEAHAAEIARQINANKDRLGKPHREWKKGIDPYQIRRDSCRAELAFSKVVGLDWDPPILPGGDGKIDITLPWPTRYGATVQIKWRSEPERDLATEGLDFWDELRADIYVLAWPGQAGSIVLAGWATRIDFWDRIFSRPPVRMLGRKYELRWQDELYPIETLIEEIERAKAVDCDQREDEEGAPGRDAGGEAAALQAS